MIMIDNDDGVDYDDDVDYNNKMSLTKVSIS